MASGPHTFSILGVFSAEQFQGNRLAIVAVRGHTLDQRKKVSIAQTFGFTGTVFIHDSPGPGLPRRLEIFTEKGEELSFSGHCILGAAHYVFQCCELDGVPEQDKPHRILLMTKAGPVSVLFNPQRKVARCSVPHAFHLHNKLVNFEQIVNVQPQIRIVPTVKECSQKSFPVVSIVKGMTFALVDLTDAPEVLGALKAAPAPEVELDDEWKDGYVGALYYKRKPPLMQAGEPTIHAIQARAITKGVEDPALRETTMTDGKSHDSAISTEDQIAKKTAEVTLEERKQMVERHVYAIQQGVEMGRICTIAVEVDLVFEADGSKKISVVTLSGRANFFAKGELVRG